MKALMLGGRLHGESREVGMITQTPNGNGFADPRPLTYVDLMAGETYYLREMTMEYPITGTTLTKHYVVTLYAHEKINGIPAAQQNTVLADAFKDAAVRRWCLDNATEHTPNKGTTERHT